MGVRVLLLGAAILTCGGVEAAERFTLVYPGWTFYLRLDPPRLAVPESAPRRILSLAAPGRPLLSENGLRLPLGGSGFLSIEAALVERRTNPALPETTKYVLRAGLGVGMEF